MKIPALIEGVQTGHLRVSPPRWLTEAQDVTAALQDHGGVGWVCTSDRVTRWPGEPLRTRVLSAELTDGPSTLHVRFSAGRWLLSSYEEGQGEPTLIRERSFIQLGADRSEGGRALYHCHWRQREEDGVRVWRPWIAIFKGWKS